jgi:hypothetical protein
VAAETPYYGNQILPQHSTFNIPTNVGGSVSLLALGEVVQYSSPLEVGRCRRLYIVATKRQEALSVVITTNN